MDKNKEMKISKTMCYILRHNPGEFGLHLDTDGFCNINDLYNALKKRYKDISKEDIEFVVDKDSKGRYEIKENRIRTVYGHSKQNAIAHTRTTPPDILYHGTTEETYNRFIKFQGLKNMKRSHVHLSDTIETAKSVASRRKNQNHVLLEIDAITAYKDGINFYEAKDDVYLSDNISAKYITNVSLI